MKNIIKLGLIATAAVGAATACTAQAETAVPPTPRATTHAHAGDVSWPQKGRVLDQGQTNACTGFAIAGLVGEDSSTAMKIYTKATQIDSFPGAYPEKDTATTPEAALEAARRLGVIKRYRTIHRASKALSELQNHPEVVSLMWPKPTTGHELILLARHGDVLTLQNSWGKSWGNRGQFNMTVAQFKKAFVEAAYVE